MSQEHQLNENQAQRMNEDQERAVRHINRIFATIGCVIVGIIRELRYSSGWLAGKNATSG